ncbi:MAG: hypothetical protein GQ527_02515 [Bacteroidales bacterium]|nr:hypothetical protein [Bacteroidales bacterium]
MKKLFTTIILSLLCVFSFAQIEMGGDTDFTQIEEDGTVEFHGEATVWNDYVVPMSVAKLSAVEAPSWETFLGGLHAFNFADESLSNKEEEVEFVIQMPHDWDGSAIYPHIHWSPDDDGSGSVVWAMEYSWVEFNYSTPLEFPEPTTITTTSASLSNDGHKHLIAPFASITPSSSQDAISSIIIIRFYRNSSNAADTYESGAFAISFDIHYRLNTIGSREEYIK